MNSAEDDTSHELPGSSPYTADEQLLLEELSPPPNFKVLLYNDNFTTMEFVIELLTSLFLKTQDQAQAIMLKVHREGFGIAGIYSKEIAETKIDQALIRARKNDYPLRLSMEES